MFAKRRYFLSLLPLIVCISTAALLTSARATDYTKELAGMVYGSDEAAFRDTLKGKNVDVEYEVKVWTWFRKLDAEHVADVKAMAQISAAQGAEVKAGTLTPEKEAKFEAQAQALQKREADRKAAVADFNRREADQRKASNESADRREMIAELRQQSDYLRQIRDNQDAVNPNAPTRY